MRRPFSDEGETLFTVIGKGIKYSAPSLDEMGNVAKATGTEGKEKEGRFFHHEK